MPHTSHRKRDQQQQDKRSKIPLADGWTLVTRSGVKAKDESVNQDLSDSSIPRAREDNTMASSSTNPKTTVADLKRDYESYLKRWKTSPIREKLVSVQDGIVGSYIGDCDDGIGIQQRLFRSVCVGLGSLCEEGESRARSLWQFAVWMDVCDTFDNFFGRFPLKRFIQDPRFTSVDKAFFASLKVTVLEHPAASTAVTHRTFLYAPFLQWTLLLSDFLARNPPPDFVITAGVEEIASADVDLKLGEDAGKYSTEEKEGFKKTALNFIEGSWKMKVPELEEFPAALMGLVCYWPKIMDYDEAWKSGEMETGEQNMEDEGKDGIGKLVERLKDKL